MTPRCSHWCLFFFSSHPTWTVRHLKVSTPPTASLHLSDTLRHSPDSPPLFLDTPYFVDSLLFPPLSQVIASKKDSLMSWNNWGDLFKFHVCNIFNILIVSKSVKLKPSLWISDSYNESHFQCLNFYNERPEAQNFLPDVCPTNSSLHTACPISELTVLLFCWLLLFENFIQPYSVFW